MQLEESQQQRSRKGQRRELALVLGENETLRAEVAQLTSTVKELTDELAHTEQLVEGLEGEAQAAKRVRAGAGAPRAAAQLTLARGWPGCGGSREPSHGAAAAAEHQSEGDGGSAGTQTALHARAGER